MDFCPSNVSNLCISRYVDAIMQMASTYRLAGAGQNVPVPDLLKSLFACAKGLPQVRGTQRLRCSVSTTNTAGNVNFLSRAFLRDLVVRKKERQSLRHGSQSQLNLAGHSGEFRQLHFGRIACAHDACTFVESVHIECARAYILSKRMYHALCHVTQDSRRKNIFSGR